MKQRRLLTILLVLLASSSFVIARYWYDISQVMIGSGLFSLDDTIQDTQAIKHWLFLLQGIALGAHCFTSFKLVGAKAIKLLSGVLLCVWIVLVMVHAVVGASILS
ncbi:MAG TPA: hypothetical protein PKE21_07630 [Flavobacteriales bacterium]|nr:hypothetical protein [Flavobacteriales bacterium]HMR27330.1 hypothetical protein [Flavobacteriales bacterium]